MNKTLFEKYVNVIRIRAHYYSNKYGIDYDEMESQGFLIYCECLDKYDINKSSFCTYLYIELNRLRDFARTYNRQRGVLIQDYYNTSNYDVDDIESMIPAREVSAQLNDFLMEAKNSLSEAAYDLMVWIIGRSWEGKYRRVPTISTAVKHFRSPKQAIKKLWDECGDFWNSKGFALYV